MGGLERSQASYSLVALGRDGCDVLGGGADVITMIEAVENHTPEVIAIDEIGTTSEAMAARTIAQRGESSHRVLVTVANSR
eukprot:7438717-Pyramimonas_sp.AAC.1